MPAAPQGYRDNIVSSATTPYVNNGTGVDGGNNFPLSP